MVSPGVASHWQKWRPCISLRNELAAVSEKWRRESSLHLPSCRLPGSLFCPFGLSTNLNLNSEKSLIPSNWGTWRRGNSPLSSLHSTSLLFFCSLVSSFLHRHLRCRLIFVSPRTGRER